MNNKILYKVFIFTFVALYVCTAGISFFHAVEFFNIGNLHWMSIVLAAVFEIGQATVLASLLLTDNKKALMPWILMILLTTVQVIGNVYSTYKFMALSDINYYQYLEKPLLFWANGISQETVMIIISYIIGALLPIVALCMTSMVTTNIKLQGNENTNKNNLSVPNESEISNNDKIINIDDGSTKMEEDIYENLLNIKSDIDVENIITDNVIENINENVNIDDKKEYEKPIIKIEPVVQQNRNIKSVEF